MKNIIYWIKRIFRKKPRFRQINREIEVDGVSGYIETGWNPSKELYPGHTYNKTKTEK